MSISISAITPEQNAPWVDIFNTVAFFNLYKTSNSVFLSLSSEQKVVGYIHFTETEPGVYKSPYRGTYGSFSFDADVKPETAHECIGEVSAYMRQQFNAKKLIIVSAPFSHDLHQSSWLFQLLLFNGFAIAGQEINQSIAVDEIPIFEKMLRNNKKRYNKCKREGFIFEQVTDSSDFKSAYDVVKLNREFKGYPVTMSLEQIMDLYQIFPDRLFFFKVRLDLVDAASSICIKLNDKVLYVFYWGHTPGFEQYSPIAFLAAGIYDFALQNGFKLIDAGTSSLNGQPNFGLAAFKENLGFNASVKLVYSKTFQ